VRAVGHLPAGTDTHPASRPPPWLSARALAGAISANIIRSAHLIREKTLGVFLGPVPDVIVGLISAE
jgi:hypothetical protein